MDISNTAASGALGVGSARIGGEATQDKPLTMHITDNLSSLSSLAEEIDSRLYNLRDRLFGAEPTNLNAATERSHPAFDPGSFAGMSKANLVDLRTTLNSIDRLSNEIANRL